MWISVDASLPQANAPKLVFDGSDCFIAKLQQVSTGLDLRWYDCEGMLYGITHWMPLPEPPLKLMDVR